MSKSPDAFRTISEVAEWLDTPAHVLRFWESKFAQVKPVKRAGGRRYYRPSDMRLLGGIKKLLHDDGMTIKGVQKILSEQGVKAVAALAPPLEGEVPEIEHEALEAASPERPPHPVDETIEDAPFIEAEAPASTVVPFTGGALAETPDGESERDVPAQPPLPDREIAETASEVADPTMGTDEMPASDAEAEDVEALARETLADPAPEAPAADVDVGEDKGSLFGQAPEFLAKPFEERGAAREEADDAPAKETTESDATEPAVTANQPHGPLKHLGGLTRLTTSEAAAIAPLLKVLRERARPSA